MGRLVNDMIDSAALYGVIAFFSFWTMIGSVRFDYAEWVVPYLWYAMAALPLFLVMDVMLFAWRVWRGKETWN